MGPSYGSLDTISVAISYTRNSNERYLESLIDLIRGFESKRKYNVSVFLDRGNIGGDKFDIEISGHFKNADIIICLVTNGFLVHPYILKEEKPIIKRFSSRWRGNKRVVPIIVTRTNNYTTSWLGKRRLTTLPTETAPKRPYSSYDNEEYARVLVKDGLDEIFQAFHNEVVLPRLKNRRNFKLLVLSLILILLTPLFWKYIQNRNKPVETETPREPPEWHDPSRPIVRVNPDESDHTPPSSISPDIPEVYDEPGTDNIAPDPDLIRPGGEREIVPPEVISCNSKASMESVFPRELGRYPYFGKEEYYRYESCQALNKEGYKPCKLNRRWYIVNESKGQHLLLKLSPQIHKDIYAIRPLLNNVAEVYYYDGQSMYLGFCVSLSDGEEVE